MNKIEQVGNLMIRKVADKIIERFNREVGKNGSVILIGGEPLLNWNVVKRIIEQCNGIVILFTNANNLTKDKTFFLKRNKVIVLMSVDGYTKKHNKARFHPYEKDKFKQIKDNIKFLIKSGCRYGLATVVHGANINDLVNIAKYFLKNINCKIFSFNYPHYTIEETEINRFPMDKYYIQISKLFDFAKKNQIYIDQIAKILRGILKKKVIYSACKVASSQRTFYPDGRETLCTKLDTIPNYLIENFKKYLPINNNKCSSCIAVNLCGGGCPWDAVMNPNNVGVDKRICRYNKSIIGYILRDIEKELKNVETKEEALEILKKKYYPIMDPVWKN